MGAWAVTNGIRARHWMMCQRGGWALKGVDWRRDRVSTKTLGLEGGWIVRSYIGWRGEWNRVWKPLTSRRVLETLRGSLEGKAQGEQYQLMIDLGYYKWAMCKRGGWALKWVDTRRCASKDIEPWRGWIGGLEKGTSASKDAEPKRGLDCEISHRFVRRMKHSLGVKTSL